MDACEPVSDNVFSKTFIAETDMAGFKSFQELSEYLKEDELRRFLSKNKASKIAYLREKGITIHRPVFGKYNREKNSVEVNIPNPFTGERPISIKLVEKYDIPQNDKMLQVSLLINDNLNENSDPSELLVCDITQSKKDEIARIKKNRESQLAEKETLLKKEKERRRKEKEREEQREAWYRLQEESNRIFREIKDRYGAVNSILYRAFDDLSKAYIRRQYHPSEGYPSEYDNIIHQERYILRYLYAYSCEYIKLFLDLIEMGLNKDTVNVLSAGCGSMIDAWSFLEATKRTKSNIRRIQYTGLDINEWIHTVESGELKKSFIPTSAGRYYERLQSLEYDLYCFPKSIGDIAGDGITRINEDFEKIINAFKTKQIEKDPFFVAISMISYKDSPRNDIIHAERIKNVILERGYACKEKRWKGEETFVGESLRVEYPFDFDSISTITGSNPMMSRKYENYVIYKFSTVN